MSKIDHADDAVDHGVADGDQSIDRAEHDAVDQLLGEIIHCVVVPKMPTSGLRVFCRDLVRAISRRFDCKAKPVPFLAEYVPTRRRPDAGMSRDQVFLTARKGG